jgi:hypothetical protein
MVHHTNDPAIGGGKVAGPASFGIEKRIMDDRWLFARHQFKPLQCRKVSARKSNFVHCESGLFDGASNC